jgi:hypothetical protein
MAKPTTITITNFGGRLTRYKNGDLNSGMAKFDTSFGYDPFSKPGNLTWLNQPDDIKGSTITDAVLAGKIISPSTNEQYVYAIGNTGRLYKVDPTQSASTNTPLFDSPSLIAGLNNTLSGGQTSVAGNFNYGADIDYYNSKLHITSDSTIIRCNIDGSAIGSVTGANSVQSALYHPMVQFLGSLYIGNGSNLLKIDTSGLVVSAAVLSPALPSGMYISDLDVTPDGVYMIITASYLYPFAIGTPTSARGQPYAVDSYKFYWNGTDAGITAFEALPSFPATALNTFLDKNFTFNQDAFGTAIYEGPQKLLSLPNNLSPMPNAAAPNGTFLTWASTEGTGTVTSADTSYDNTYTSLYYYGRLDAENPPGLWRLLRVTPTSNVAYRAPVNMLVNNFTMSRQFVAGWGKHYISAWEVNTDGDTNTFHFYRFTLPPTANTSPVLGVYETQTQLFSKRIHVDQVRVYTEGTAANNGFRIDLIGADGNSNYNNTYTYVAGTDETKLQGSLERINFNPDIESGYAVGVRMTNTGTANMTIPKIELDISDEGR